MDNRMFVATGKNGEPEIKPILFMTDDGNFLIYDGKLFRKVRADGNGMDKSCCDSCDRNIG